MKTTHLTRTLLAGAIVTFTATASQAAIITWGAATGIAGDSDVSTAGTLVEAYDFRVSPAPPVTVNGVQFDAFFPTAVVSTTVGSLTFTAGSGAVGTDNNHSNVTGAFAALSAPYQQLLQSIVGDGGFPNGPGFTLTWSALTVGQTYEFQWWQSGELGSPTTTATAGNSVTLDKNPSALAGGVGQFAIGTFVADNAQQIITFTGGGQPYLNAAQLRQTSQPGGTPIPEPTTALFGLALVGICGLARRRATAQG